MTGKILIVDRDSDYRVSCESTLISEGYSVRSVSSLAEAEGCLRSESFDLIVLELDVADENWSKAARRFLQNDASIKVVINGNQPQLRLDFHTWLADDFVDKSADFTALKSSVANVLMRDRRNQANLKP